MERVEADPDHPNPIRASLLQVTGDEEDPNATQEDRINIDHDEPIEAPVVPQTHPSTTSAMPTITNGDVDEDEWAAFERDVVAPSAPSPPPPNPLSIINTNATISAAPMTAAELEAQKKKEGQQAQRILRAEEIEAEKEDAARNLEEEFEEMEALEERVKKLKEKRERLRAGNLESEVFIGASPSLKEARSEEGNEDEEEDDDDEDLEDEWDTWGFGRP